jgi:hypothetical protein
MDVHECNASLLLFIWSLTFQQKSYCKKKTCVFFIMGCYYLKRFKYYIRPLHSEDVYNRHTQGSHSAYEIKTRRITYQNKKL